MAVIKLGRVVGDKGDKGDTGATGPQGPKGDTGPAGPSYGELDNWSRIAPAAKADKSYADQIKAVADAAMPKSGGTFTWNIRTVGDYVGLRVDALDGTRRGTFFAHPGGGCSLLSHMGTDDSSGELSLIDNTLLWNGGDLGRWAAIDPASKVNTSSGVMLSPTVTNGWLHLDQSEGSGRRSVHNNTGTIGFVGTGGGWILRVDDSGQCQAGDFISTSDARLKDNIAARVIPLQDITTVLPKSWDWKNGNGHSAGVIAQDLQEILPELVNTGDEGMLSVSEGKAALVIALSLAQHLKDAIARIAALEAKLSERS